MDNLILINKEFGLNTSFVPDDLIIVDDNENNFHNYIDPNLKPQIKKEVFEHFLEMKREAFDHAGIELLIDSGYRSAEYQRVIWDQNYQKMCHELRMRFPYMKLTDLENRAFIETCKYVALPGHSEHQTGLAIDLARIKDRMYNDQMKGTFEAEWLHNNAYRYGFILRYPLGKENITGYNFEPWHYRYVGECSNEFYDGDYLTLEEYHNGLRLIKK